MWKDAGTERMLAADREVERLEAALAAARRIADRLTTEYSGHDLAPRFDVELTTGSRGQPLLVFRLDLALDKDVSSETWPDQEVAEMKTRLTARMTGSPAGWLDWYVVLRAKHRRPVDDRP